MCTILLNQYYWVQKPTYLITFRLRIILLLTITAGFSFYNFWHFSLAILLISVSQRLGVLLLGLGVLLEIAKVVEGDDHIEKSDGESVAI